MSQNYDVNVGINPDFQSAGRQIIFHGAFVTNLVITNNSAVSVQYSADAGVTWNTVAPSVVVAPNVPDASTFFMRRMSTGAGPAFVRMSWRASDSLDPTSNVNAGLYYLTPQRLKNFRKAVANVLGGAGNGRLLCAGDSTTLGTGCVAGGLGVGVKNGSYPTRLAQCMTAAGIMSTIHSTFGNFGSNSAPTYDTRFVLGDFTFDPTVTTLGGSSFKATAATANPATFTPKDPVTGATVNTDTCEIYYATAPGLGSFNANVSGGSNTLQSCAAANGVAKVTITGTLGANDYRVSRNAGTVNILGFIAYDSTVKQVQVVNTGKGGAKSGDFILNWQGPAAHIAAIAPNLTILELGINDWLQAIDPAVFQSNMQTLITAALASGDCVLVSPISQNPSGTPTATQAAYKSAVAALALSNGVPYFDLNARWISYTDANALGFYYPDGIHPSAPGYADKGRAIFNLLMQQ